MSPETVAVLARELYAIHLPARRAVDLANEITRLEASVRETAAHLALDDACWSHAAAVTSWIAGKTGAADG